MSDDNDNDDYKVGYGKPPKHTQFRKGQSGNLNGRPKTPRRNQKTILDDIVNQRARLSINGRMQTLTMLEALYWSLLHDALKGDRGARTALMHLLRENGYFDKTPPGITYGVLRVREPMKDAEEWSRQAQEQQRIAAERDRNFNVDEFIAAQKTNENSNEEPPPSNKRKRPRIRIVKKRT